MGLRTPSWLAGVLAVLFGLGAGVPSAAVSSSGGSAIPSQLSAAQLAGQRIVYAYAGLQPPPSLLAAIRAGEAGGVILFSNNFANRTQLRSAVAELQRTALASPVHERLLIMTDQEGGEVRRLPGAPVPSQKQIGESRSGASLATSAGTGAGRNLAGVGINLNLAPVLDVYRQRVNFIDQFGRSYSSRSTTVSSLGAAFIRAQQRAGVAATAKHFPGLGAATTAQNTDLRPVTLNLRLGTVRAVDEAPYRAAIGAGVKVIMTSWATYPALDPTRPAGLSAVVIQKELRDRLGFRGVTISDGIEAGALRRFGSLARRSVLAAGAGADLILCAATDPADNSPQIGLTALHALAAAISGGQLGLASARQAAEQVLALRG
jgi:beta-N-acetylhexosaminidase